MRVAVRHTDESHPNAHWFAFEHGRILGFTDPIEGDSYSAEAVAEALLRRAKEQYPGVEGYEHRVETLHVKGTDENGNEIGEWYPAGKSDLPRVGAGSVAEHTLETQQGQEAGNE